MVITIWSAILGYALMLGLALGQPFTDTAQVFGCASQQSTAFELLWQYDQLRRKYTYLYPCVTFVEFTQVVQHQSPQTCLEQMIADVNAGLRLQRRNCTESVLRRYFKRPGCCGTLRHNKVTVVHDKKWPIRHQMYPSTFGNDKDCLGNEICRTSACGSPKI